MTCIGNSGPLPEPIANAVEEKDLVVGAVLSGNRNFEGRINPHVKANYLASPPLVVAYALAGTVDVNLMDEPLAKNDKGEQVYLRDIWPTQQEVNATMAACIVAGDVPQAVRQRRRRQRGVERDPRQGRRAVQLRRGQHVHPGAAVLHRPVGRPQADQADHGRAGAGDGRRQRDDRPHLPRRRDQEGQPGRQVPDGARRPAGRLQQLRRPPRQRPGDDPRHLRQHPPAQPARPRHRGRRHPVPRPASSARSCRSTTPR